MDRPKRLSATFVRSVSTPGRYGDGRGGYGLSLLVKSSTTGRVSKSWAQRLRVGGEPFNIGLGSFPLVTLAAARDMALENARRVAAGNDPREKVERAPTFAAALERAIEVLRPNWKNQRTEKIMRDRMSKWVLPHIGRRRVDSITPADVLAFLTPLALEKPATADKVQGLISQVFQWGIAQGYRADNPSDRNINQALPKRTAKEHHKALPFSEVAGAIRTIRDTSAWPATKLAFEFLVFTATRSGEVRLAEWSEIDGDVWTIPAARMKSGREHRVPLSRAAMGLLEQARELVDGSGLVFPSATGKPMSDNTMSKMLRDNSIGAVPHGFRSSFRDWCAEHSIDRQVAESSLAHIVGNAVEVAYLRSDFFNLRRAAMDAWADYLNRGLDGIQD